VLLNQKFGDTFPSTVPNLDPRASVRAMTKYPFSEQSGTDKYDQAKMDRYPDNSKDTIGE
jgi:hypothetical protein